MRITREISQLDLGKETGLSQREISYIENAKRPLSQDAITCILNYFNHNSSKPISNKEWHSFVLAYLNDTLNSIAVGVGLELKLESSLSTDNVSTTPILGDRL